MELFPVPSTPTHYTEFRRLPGATSESTKVLRKLLLENHEKWHIMFNDEGFHKYVCNHLGLPLRAKRHGASHISHHLLALWSLGASAESLQKAYDAEIDQQRPIKISEDVVPITEDNFCDHLGEQRCLLYTYIPMPISFLIRTQILPTLPHILRIPNHLPRSRRDPRQVRLLAPIQLWEREDAQPVSCWCAAPFHPRWVWAGVQASWDGQRRYALSPSLLLSCN